MADVFAGKSIIGIVGGIGSGKTFIAKLFGESGCLVISSDDAVREAYQSDEVKNTLRQWWGDQIVRGDGEIDRRAIAARVFSDPAERKRLEALLHPLAHAKRQQLMEAAAHGSQVLAYVWDTPLLVETGLNRQCDAVVFVETPLPLRLQRVRTERGWDEPELSKRENSQSPLDRKREISDYVISNTADAGDARGQVKQVLSRILAKSRQAS